MFPVIEDAGRMSIAAYGNDPEVLQALRQEGWSMLTPEKFRSGLNVAVWERHLSNGNTERIVAFVGTKDFPGAAADVEQAAVGPEMTPQYRDALDFARRQIAEKDKNPRLTVTFTGYSLGGGLAQLVNLELGVRTVVFNSAPLNVNGLLAKDRVGQAHVATNDLWNLRTKGDIISALPLEQYGRVLSFDAVRPTTGQWLGDYSIHSVQALLDAINGSRAITVAPATGYPTAADMQRLADSLDYVKKTLDVVKPFADLKGLDDIVDYGQKFADLSAAIKQDAEEKRDFFSNSSHTVQKLAELELDMGPYANKDRLKDFARLGLISDVAARRFRYVSFGAGDIAGGLGTMAGQHSLGSADAWEKVLDGVAATAWGIYGFVITPSLDPAERWEVAQAFASASRLATKGARAMTLPMVEQIFAKVTGRDRQFIALWEEAQKVRIANGKPAQTIEEFYKGIGSILDTIGPDEMSQADARLGLTSHPGLSAEPPDSSSRQPPDAGGGPIGGIRLEQPLTGAALRGVKIDEANGNIVLIGERDFLARGVNLRDFAMALWLECGPDEQDPQFSLDPDDPKNPKGEWLRAVYMPQSLQGRSFGAELFNGDLLLKELSFQAMLSPEGKLVEWTPAVPGFSSYVKFAMDSPERGTAPEQFARFWIVADRVTSKRVGDTLIFDARMAVKARRQVPDPSSRTGLRDVDTASDTLEAEWAQQLTKYYDQLSEGSPALARVQELAKAVAIAKSVKAAGAQVDLTRIADFLNSDHTPTVSKINAFSAKWQREQQFPFHEGNSEGVRIEREELHLFGGVDLTVHPVAIPDNGESQAIGESAKAAFHMAEPGTKVVHFTYDRTPLAAIELPLLLKASQ